MTSPTSPSRRTFLSATASALAFPAIVPSSVFGATAPSNRIHLAAIGVGSRGYNHLRHTFDYADLRYVAAVDCFTDRRERFANEANAAYGKTCCLTHLDAREALAREDVDGVVINTPDHWHVPLAIEAARAGKHLYVEKPLGIALSWAWKLREELRERDLVFQYGTQQRSMPQFRQACELVRNGYIGEVQRVEAWCPDMSTQFDSASVPPYGSTLPVAPPEGFDYDRWLGPAPLAPYTADRCTSYGAWHIYDYALGFIAGWGAHPLDIAQWGLDMDHSGPVRIEGRGTLPPEGSLWNTTESWDVHAEYANKVQLRFMGSRVAHPIVQEYLGFVRGHGTTFFGSEGWISVDRRSLYSPNRHAMRKIELTENDTRLPKSTGQIRNFVDAIRTGQPPISPLESAIRSDTISHLSDISIRVGRTLEWDPQKEQIVDDPDAMRFFDRPMRSPWRV